MKSYQLYHGELLQAETKLRHAENQRLKVEQQQNAGGVVAARTAISRRFRNYDKLSEKVSRHDSLTACVMWPGLVVNG